MSDTVHQRVGVRDRYQTPCGGRDGRQWAGRVGLFLQVDDFALAHDRMVDHAVVFVGEPRHEPYGTVAVFLDIAGNRWDLLGPGQVRR